MLQALAFAALLLAAAASGSFEFVTQQLANNFADYQDYVQTRCVEIVQGPWGWCEESQDCSPVSHYQCSDLREVWIRPNVDGGVDMYFEGHVTWWGYEECGEGPTCPECTNHKTCVGPMTQTNVKRLEAGNCVHWEYNTKNGKDAFEIFVGVFDAAGEIVSYTLQRGNYPLDWTYNQLRVTETGDYYLRFFLASYDETGGGVVGASMAVRNVVHTSSCLDDKTLALGPLVSRTTVTNTQSSTSSTSHTATTTSSFTSSVSSTTSSSNTISSSTSSNSITTSSTTSSSSSTGSNSSTTTSSTFSLSTSSSTTSTTDTRSTTSSSSSSSSVSSSSTTTTASTTSTTLSTTSTSTSTTSRTTSYSTRTGTTSTTYSSTHTSSTTSTSSATETMSSVTTTTTTSSGTTVTRTTLASPCKCDVKPESVHNLTFVIGGGLSLLHDGLSEAEVSTAVEEALASAYNLSYGDLNASSQEAELALPLPAKRRLASAWNVTYQAEVPLDTVEEILGTSASHALNTSAFTVLLESVLRSRGVNASLSVLEFSMVTVRKDGIDSAEEVQDCVDAINTTPLVIVIVFLGSCDAFLLFLLYLSLCVSKAEKIAPAEDGEVKVAVHKPSAEEEDQEEQEEKLSPEEPLKPLYITRKATSAEESLSSKAETQTDAGLYIMSEHLVRMCEIFEAQGFQRHLAEDCEALRCFLQERCEESRELQQLRRVQHSLNHRLMNAERLREELRSKLDEAQPKEEVTRLEGEVTCLRLENADLRKQLTLKCEQHASDARMLSEQRAALRDFGREELLRSGDAMRAFLLCHERAIQEPAHLHHELADLRAENAELHLLQRTEEKPIVQEKPMVPEKPLAHEPEEDDEKALELRALRLMKKRLAEELHEVRAQLEQRDREVEQLSIWKAQAERLEADRREAERLEVRAGDVTSRQTSPKSPGTSFCSSVNAWTETEADAIRAAFKELDVFKLDVIARELMTFEQGIEKLRLEVKVLKHDSERLHNLDERERLGRHWPRLMEHCGELKFKVQDVIHHCLSETQKLHIGAPLELARWAGQPLQGGVASGTFLDSGHAQWTVVRKHGIQVFALPDSGSEVMGQMEEGAVVEGDSHGEWIKLADNTGHVKLIGPQGPYLKRLDQPDHGNSRGAALRQSDERRRERELRKASNSQDTVDRTPNERHLSWTSGDETESKLLPAPPTGISVPSDEGLSSDGGDWF